ncbi:MAG: hypothetical protein Kow009_14120 [Spirochaetales bacterium]
MYNLPVHPMVRLPRFVQELRLLDGAAILLSIVVLGAFSLHAYMDQGGEAALYIQNESKVWIYPLGKEEELDIPGPLGLTHIHIKDGAAFVESSPCRDKICIHMGKISRNGEWVACLPNRVFMRVQGKAGGQVDASTF